MSFRSGISIDCISDPLLMTLISMVSAVNANIYGGEYTVGKDKLKSFSAY